MPWPTAAIGCALVKISASGPMPTSRYCDQAPCSISTRLSSAACLLPGTSLARVAAELGLHAPADRLGLLGRAPRLLLDHPLQHRQRKRHARGLDGLQVDRRQQPGLLCIALRLRRVGEDVPERADPLALAFAHDRCRIGRLRQIAHRRRQLRDVPDAIAAHRHHGRTAGIGPPDAPGQRSRRAVLAAASPPASCDRLCGPCFLARAAFLC